MGGREGRGDISEALERCEGGRNLIELIKPHMVSLKGEYVYYMSASGDERRFWYYEMLQNELLHIRPG